MFEDYIHERNKAIKMKYFLSKMQNRNILYLMDSGIYRYLRTENMNQP